MKSFNYICLVNQTGIVQSSVFVCLNFLRNLYYLQSDENGVADDYLQESRACSTAVLDCCRQYPYSQSDGVLFCPASYDGHNCFPPQRVNETIWIDCPAKFYPVASERVFRTCDVSLRASRVNYADCFGRRIARTALTLSTVTSSISFVAIVIVLAAFCCFKQLRAKTTIQLHLHLLTALMLKYTAELLVDHLSSSALISNVAVCSLVHLMHQLFALATYLWMSVEVYYLHRLFSWTFASKLSVRVGVAWGWGMPVCLVACCYGVDMAVLGWKHVVGNCFEHSGSQTRWLLQLIIGFCLFANWIVLMRVALFLRRGYRMEANTKNRRRLKELFVAIMLLVPLFSVCHIATSITYPRHWVGFEVYELFCAVLLHSTGISLSVIFAAANRDLRYLLRAQCASHATPRSLGRPHNLTLPRLTSDLLHFSSSSTNSAPASPAVVPVLQPHVAAAVPLQQDLHL